VVVRALPAGGVTSCNRQPLQSSVVHDHIRSGEHKIDAITCIVVGIGASYMEHAGTTQRGETVSCSSRGVELSSGGGSPRYRRRMPVRQSRDCDQARRRTHAAIGPVAAAAVVAGPSGSGSRRLSESSPPVLRSQSRSGLGRVDPGFAAWRRGEPEDRRDACSYQRDGAVR
jgi:hypothetical protein